MDRINPTVLKNPLRDNFTVITNQVVNDPDLSWGAKGVLCYLLSKPTDWQFFVADIVKHAKCSEHEVQKLLKELEQAGYLKRYKTVRPGTNRLYWVWEVSGTGDLRQAQIATIVNYDNRKNGPYTNTDSNSNTDLSVIPLRDKDNTDVLSSSLPPKGAGDAAWEEFWNEYKPVKTKDGLVAKGSKKVAEKKYKQLLAKGVKPEDILRGLRAYLTYCQNNGRLTCGVSVFLNQERWKDEYGGTVALACQQNMNNAQEELMRQGAEFLRKYGDNNASGNIF
jgi:hypothetical protein